MEGQETLFMGHPLSYWIQLHKHAEDLDVVDLIQELAEAYGKIGFYERRIAQMWRLQQAAKATTPDDKSEIVTRKS